MSTNWYLVASHGAVLFYLAMHDQATIREVAHDIELTERRVSQIIRDLSDSDILQVERHGRRNSYRVNPDVPLDIPMSGVTMGQVLTVVRDAQERRESVPA